MAEDTEVQEQVQEKKTWQALQDEFAGITANDSTSKPQAPPQQKQPDPTTKTEGPPQGGQPEGDSSTPSGGEGGGAGDPAPTNTPVETPPAEGDPAPAPEGDPAPAPAAEGDPAPDPEPAPEPEPEYYASDEEYFADFSKKVGYEVTSEDDKVELIKSLSNTDPYEKFSPFLKAAIDYEKNGGHAKEYFDTYVPVEGMTDKDLFRQKWNQDNAAALATNPDFASQKFEREFKSRFDLIGTDMKEGDFEDSPEEYQQYLADKKFQKEELGFEAQSFKAEVDKKRENAFEGAPSFAPQEAMTPEEAAEIAETYSNDARTFQNDFEGIDLPLDPEGKDMFTVGLNAKSQPLYEQWLSDPQKYLDFIGFDKETKTIDVSRFGPHVAMSAMLAVPGKESLGVQLMKYVSEQKAENTVETKLEHPKDNAKPAPNIKAPTSVVEQIDEIADAVAKNYRPAV